MVNSYQKIWLELGLVIAVFIIIFFGEWLGLVQPVISFFERGSQPALIRVDQIVAAANQPLVLLKSSLNASQQVKELEQAYSLSLARILELEYLESENNELRQLLQVQEKETPMKIAVPIISRGQPSISIGKADNVRVGQPVLVAEMLVGVIRSISDHQSVVGLLAQDNKTSILAKTESGVSGLVVGNGKNILLTEIPKEAQLSIGELVVTVGQEQIHPQLILGQVQQIIDQPSAPVKEAILTQKVSFYEASIVEVIQ
ncbi:MAG: rod shape-determining protein MreC [Candidatus Pacebacteria bacterium]|jgi:rod shape-determining protein MreC|nr:rod shape-determining protein MreC [Candidatus Paceibacterota bacterium]MBT3512030.1 rod shape-determining protein MreC [Candidatus Paceibacterota bacterium]MBT4004882.1 rod shape-determining protein MreC [Candidatus Paceibacterota bacterium]MBT4359061.1 rod shape-determining protein MreC [Candidatus Paceibacterota bacterium]MBT4680548.1 rod shape-determining protein MreC [Candidatus Paceibacterota bacterium]